MTVIQNDGKRPRRRPSMKGAVSFAVRNGQEQVTSWPKRRGKNVPQKTKEQMEWFRQAQAAAKYLDPDMYFNIVEACKGSPLLPRDLITMMLSGRLLAFHMPDGKVIWSTVVANDVSQSLDTITQTLGDILRRGINGWEGVPYPVTPPGRGSILADHLNQLPNSVAYGDTISLAGSYGLCQKDTLISGITVYQLIRAGSVNVPIIMEIDDVTGAVISILATGDAFTPPYDYEGAHVYSLTSNAEMFAGTTYAFVIMRTDSGTASNIGFQYFAGTSNMASAPIEIKGLIQFATITVPIAGDVPTLLRPGQPVYHVGVVHSFP